MKNESNPKKQSGASRTISNQCNMQRYKIVLSFIIIFHGNLFAQKNSMYDKNFEGYTNYVSNEFGITCYMPQKFSDLNKYIELWMIRKDSHAGAFYGPILQANDNKCIIMYPSFPFYNSKNDFQIGKKTVMINKLLNNDNLNEEPKSGTNNLYPRSQIIFELKTAIGGFDYFGNPLSDTASFEFNDFVTIISGKMAQEMFNADSIYFYNIPLETAYQKRFSYCTGMVLSKQERATMLFKLFFTSKGKKNEEKYINMLSKQILYEENFRHETE